MDRVGFPSNDSTSNTDSYLKQLNKNSLKISKPIRKPFPPPPPPPPSTAAAASSAGVSVLDPNPVHNQAQSQQPPVYNINKNDFRDVVQKLTGSPAHERLPTPAAPPVTQPRPSSSRLQRIRPPPLAQINHRPPQLGPVVPRPQYDVGPALPPLPSVHQAAESPISAYMRVLQNSAPLGTRADFALPQQNDVGQQGLGTESPISAYMRFLQNSVYSSGAGAASPRLSGAPRPPPPPPQSSVAPPPSQQQQQPSSPFPVMPLSPLPFGCIPSPRSQYGLSSPSLFSPTGQFGLPQLPLSPTVPVPSPRWKGM